MKKYFIFLCFVNILLVPLSGVIWADNNMDIKELKLNYLKQEVIIEEQQRLIEQLQDRLNQVEQKLDGRPSQAPTVSKSVNLEVDELSALPPEIIKDGDNRFPRVDIGGYIDIGYIDAQGNGTTSSNTIFANSRADNLTTLGLDGDSSFLVNEVNIDLKAYVSEQTDVIVSFDILPRDVTFTTGGGTASTDGIELDLAYVKTRPIFKPNLYTDNLLGDLELSLGKFESPMGLEYRFNRSPDRVNISRSHQSQYTTGYPVGAKARGKLLKDKMSRFHNSALIYNLVVANSDPFLSRDYFGDIDDNNNRTIMGRFSYGLDLFGGVLESGVSFAKGASINQGDNDIEMETIMGDAQFKNGPLTLRFEYIHIDKDRPMGGSGTKLNAIFIEGFYDFPKPGYFPEWIPITSIAPYYRFDTRDINFSPTITSSDIDIERHTFALRYIPWLGNAIKAEYQLNLEDKGAKINDNMYLMSFIREF